MRTPKQLSPPCSRRSNAANHGIFGSLRGRNLAEIVTDLTPHNQYTTYK